MTIEDWPTLLVARQRERQVVELLRCAADLIVTGRHCAMPISTAAEWLGVIPGREDVFDVALEAVSSCGPCSVEQLLEAAQRVEDCEGAAS